MLKKTLRTLRITHKKTQDDLAEYLNIKRPSYTRYESGTSNPDLETLVKIANYYNVTVDYLLGREPQPYDPTMSRIASIFSTANAQARACALYCLEQGQPPKSNNVTDFPHYDISYFDDSVSAGFGNWVERPPRETLSLIKIPPVGTSFIIKVSGDSMEPTYHDGDKVFVCSQPYVDTGDVGIFVVDGEAYIKEKGEKELLPHNKKYNPIPLTPDTYCFGRVIGICDNSYFE